MRIIEFHAENIKRLRAVTIRPEELPGGKHVVTIAGDNGHGKSSCLDSIEMALAGTKSIPPEPVRHGERKARTVVDLGDLLVERTFSPKGTKLVVRDKDGAVQRSPQSILDALCASIAFDPLRFARMQPKDQDRILRTAMGLDTADLEQRRAQLYSERTAVGREHRTMLAQADALPHFPDAPAIDVDTAQLTDELEQQTARAQQNQRLRDAFAEAEDQVREAEVQLDELRQAIAQQEQAIENLKSASRDAYAKVTQLVEPDLEALRQALREAGDKNRKLEANRQRARAYTSAAEKESLCDGLTEQIQAIDGEISEKLAAVSFPVEGLGFDAELGPTLNGVPLEQASQAERLRVSVAVGLAFHPNLRVLLIREGSLLDSESLAALTNLAIENDAQLWIERVGPGEPGAVVIEDGAVLTEQTSESAQSA